MSRFQVTILLPNGESMTFARYGESIKDVADMEARRNPSAASITVEEA